MSGEEKRTPQDCGAHGEMILEMTGGGAKERIGIAGRVNARIAEAGVGGEVVVLEVEAVLDERGTSEGVITDAVAAHPRIDEREREKEEQE